MPNSPRLLPLVKVCLLAMPPYVAGPHPWADKFVPRHFSDGFGQLPFVYGDPPANQLDGFFLIGFVCKEIPHDSRFSLGIESRDPDVPSCWHSWQYIEQTAKAVDRAQQHGSNDRAGAKQQSAQALDKSKAAQRTFDAG